MRPPAPPGFQPEEEPIALAVAEGKLCRRRVRAERGGLPPGGEGIAVAFIKLARRNTIYLPDFERLLMDSTVAPSHLGQWEGDFTDNTARCRHLLTSYLQSTVERRV
ncbi:MAG: hypothetical protein ACR2JY_22555 [Chloroflexota bacterium]